MGKIFFRIIAIAESPGKTNPGGNLMGMPIPIVIFKSTDPKHTSSRPDFYWLEIGMGKEFFQPVGLGGKGAHDKAKIIIKNRKLNRFASHIQDFSRSLLEKSVFSHVNPHFLNIKIQMNSRPFGDIF